VTAKYAFVSANRGEHAVTALCRVAGVSGSGFYAWLRAIPVVRDRAEAEAELRREGRRHARRRIERLMREMGGGGKGSIGIADGKPPEGCPLAKAAGAHLGTTDSRHDHPVAPNLLARNFVADRPDQVWLADVSYIPTDEGWLYLAAIIDPAWVVLD
jgi:putative transposase